MNSLTYPRFFLVDLEDRIDEHLEREEVADVYAEKREAALQFLGEKWVLHPNYNPANNPQHNVRVTA